METRQRIQFDDINWFVLSRGTDNGTSTYCHLAACYKTQKDGKTPVQIADWVPNSKLTRSH